MLTHLNSRNAYMSSADGSSSFSVDFRSAKDPDGLAYHRSPGGAPDSQPPKWPMSLGCSQSAETGALPLQGAGARRDQSLRAYH